MFDTARIATLARNAHASIEGSGEGGTIYGVGAPKARYVVGGIATRMFAIGTASAPLRTAMGAMVGTTGAHTLGYWEHKGTLYVDLGSMHHHLDDAMAVARARGELAIYDRHTGECITVNAA